MRSFRLGFVAALSTILIACQTVPPGEAVLDGLSWPARKAWLSDQRSFEARGKISIVYGQQAEQGDFRLEHSPQKWTMRLSGPFGFGAVLLEGNDTTLQVTTARDGTVTLTDPDRELTELLGYPVPIRELSYWTLGVPRPGLPAVEELEPENPRLAALEQGGWRVDYGAYRQYEAVELPRKIDVEGSDVRIRMVFRSWRLGR